MTKVDSIDNKTCIRPLGYGIAGGALSGLALKYIYPVTDDEKNAPSYKDRMTRIENQSKLYTADTEEFLTAIKNRNTRTKVEDVFVRSFDGMRYGEHISPKVYDKAMAGIKKNSQGDIAEMQNLFKALKEYAKDCAAEYKKVLNALTRHERPTAFFLATGAIAGAAVALACHLTKSDS